MRDAFGGVFTINLFLVFIFIFVAFTAVSLNYAKAFRVKNNIIDFVEKNEIISLKEKDISSKLPQLDAILTNANYNKTCDTLGDLMNLNLQEGVYKEEDIIKGYCYKGVYIELSSKEEILGTTSTIINYNVYTAADWNLGALNKILVLGGEEEDSQETIAGSWVISGKAKVISKDK